MDGELLCLKWRDHCSSLFRTLSSVRRKEVYCDATIACDGRFYPVHKFVLSTCSDYFEQIFEFGEQKNIIIVITDIGCEELETLLDYMYFGEVNVLQSDLNTFMKAAERLRIKGLAEPSEPDQKDGYSEKRTRSQNEDNREAKRKKWSGETSLHSECSQNIADGKLNASQGKNSESVNTSRTKEHVELRKENVRSSDAPVPITLDQTRLEEADIGLNESSSRTSMAAEIKLEPFSVKIEPEDWGHAEMGENSSMYITSEQGLAYLPPTSALPISTSGLSIVDHGNTRHDNLGGTTQPLPGPSGLHSAQPWEHGGVPISLPVEEFTPYRGMTTKGMSPRKTGRPTSDIWNHYKTEKSNGKNFVICIYCKTQKYGYPNATKMKLHTVKCLKCPENIRKQYKKELAQMVAKSEANKSILLKQGPLFEAPGLN